MKQTILEAIPQWWSDPIIYFSSQEFTVTSATDATVQVTSLFGVTTVTSWLFSPSKISGTWQKTKSFWLRKSNWKKGKHLAFEEICVAFIHFHPSEDGDIPSFLKRTPHCLAFTNSGLYIFTLFNGEGFLLSQDGANRLQHCDIAEADFLYYLTLFHYEMHFVNASSPIWTIST